MVPFPVLKGGIFITDKPCEELFERCPDVKEHTTLYWNLRDKGDVIPDASGKRYVKQPFIAYFVVFSRKSRADVIRIGQKVKREFRYEIQ
jgi:hypothetical protein